MKKLEDYTVVDYWSLLKPGKSITFSIEFIKMLGLEKELVLTLLNGNYIKFFKALFDKVSFIEKQEMAEVLDSARFDFKMVVDNGCITFNG